MIAAVFERNLKGELIFMLTKHMIAVGTLALALGLSLTQCTSAQTKTATAKTDYPLVKFSQAGLTAIEAIRLARVAIFMGDPNGAKGLLNQAKISLETAAKDAPKFDIKTTMSVRGKVLENGAQEVAARLVPVDGHIVLADDFVLTPEKKAHIAKANEHIKKGESKQAFDEFRLADIDVNYIREWMPIASAQKHLDDAINLMHEDKYYEASMALRAIEDSVTTDSATMVEVPKK